VGERELPAIHGCECRFQHTIWWEFTQGHPFNPGGVHVLHFLGTSWTPYATLRSIFQTKNGLRVPEWPEINHWVDPYEVISDVQLEVSRSCVQPSSWLLLLLVWSKSSSSFAGQPTVWVINALRTVALVRSDEGTLKIYSKMLPKFRKVRWIWLLSDGRNCLKDIGLGQDNTSALPLFISMFSESMCIHWHPLLERSSTSGILSFWECFTFNPSCGFESYLRI